MIMDKSINILDQEYTQWVEELSKRYRQHQINASAKVNKEMICFYWELGRDIIDMHVEELWGEKVINNLSLDLQKMIPNISGLSRRNIYYCKQFYTLYSPYITIVPQLGAQPDNAIVPQVGAQFFSQLKDSIFSVPWGHHKLLIDKCYTNPEKAMFFIRQTVENGWSRNMLLNHINTDLYERQGKALTNFTKSLPGLMSGLALELTKDPYDFAFTGITGPYNEKLLKDALLNNITTFLIELGTGFAYVGKEYRLQIGDTENFIDLLFYNLRLSCYVVVEVKIGKFAFADVGQLSGYVVACNHILRKEGRDNPSIDLLICKTKDKVQAQYALEASSQPIGISEYELENFYPEKVEGTIPTIEEIEKRLFR